MKEDERGSFEQAESLRRSFDLSFAQAQRVEAHSEEMLLFIRLGREPYALRLSEISGLYADKKITQLPTRVSELLGVIGLRGSITPVYDFGALIGAASVSEPRWLVTTRALSLALAFEGFEGYVRLPRRSVITQEGKSWRYSREIAQSDDGIRPLIHIPAILETVQERASLSGTQKEP